MVISCIGGYVCTKEYILVSDSCWEFVYFVAAECVLVH